MAKDQDLEMDALRTEVYNLRHLVKETSEAMAEHVYGLQIGDLVYDATGRMGTVEALYPRHAVVKYTNEVLGTKIPYADLTKSRLGVA